MKGHRIQVRCPVCSVKTDIKWQLPLVTKIRVQYGCGHRSDVDKIEEFDDRLEIVALDGNKPFKYQLERIHRVEGNNGKFLHGDQQGVGKMVMCILFLRLHPEAFPALIVCKARNRMQWLKHLIIWGGSTEINGKQIPNIIPRILDGPRHAPDFSASDTYITSWDSLIVKERGKDAIIAPWIAERKDQIKTLILDEFQMMKNHEAGRTKAALLLGDGRPYLQGSSGTPVKNHGGEFWPILHLFRPDKFPSQEGFDRDFVAEEWDNFGKKYRGGIKKSRKQEFNEILKPFYDRFELADVQPDLPRVFRQFDFMDLEDKFKEEYAREQAKFMEAYAMHEAGGRSFGTWSAVSESLFKLKHIVGVAKVDSVVEQVEEFMDSSPDKVAIYHHHTDVGQLYWTHFSRICKERGLPPPVRVTAEMNDHQADDAIQRFTEGDAPLGIFRILAEGEGLNLQASGDVWITERQFNPANEEQVEGRFPRPGSKHDKVRVRYPTAVGTVDEVLTEMVENKRRFCHQTYGKAEIAWQEGTTMKDLAALLATKGMKSWKERNQDKKSKKRGSGVKIVTLPGQLRLVK